MLLPIIVSEFFGFEMVEGATRAHEYFFNFCAFMGFPFFPFFPAFAFFPVLLVHGVNVSSPPVTPASFMLICNIINFSIQMETRPVLHCIGNVCLRQNGLH